MVRITALGVVVGLAVGVAATDVVTDMFIVGISQIPLVASVIKSVCYPYLVRNCTETNANRMRLRLHSRWHAPPVVANCQPASPLPKALQRSIMLTHTNPLRPMILPVP
jgi:hypothetical protein